MKKSLLTLGALAFSAMTFAQSAYDALNFTQMDPIMGTARYSSMAGAFGALGGNPSSAKDNPAGLGVYKCFDITFTPNLYLDNDKEVGFCLNNFAVVVNFRNTGREKGYVTSSLGISYNRLRNYSRYNAISSNNYSGNSVTDKMGLVKTPDYIYNNAMDLGLIDDKGYSNFSVDHNFDKNFRYKESGHAGQWDIAYGLNISNRVYLGASMGVANLEYSQKGLYKEKEKTLNIYSDNWYLDNYYRVSGVGVNFKIGAIAKVTDFFRIGLSVHTPTFYNVDEEYSVEMDYNNQYPATPEIEYNSYKYDMTTPFKFQGSLGFVIAKRALIGVQYDLENYQSIRIKNQGMIIEQERELAKEMFRKTHTIRLGGEVKIIDQLAIRAGYAFTTTPIEYDKSFGDDFMLFRPMSLPNTTRYITGGIGYEGKHFYCDVAYVYRNQTSYVYEMLPKLDSSWKLNNKNSNFLATFGWRF